MATKSKSAKQKAVEAEKIYKEAQEELKKAQEEERQLLIDSRDKIDKICKDNQLFCGTVVTVDDVPALIKMLIHGNGIVRIPYSVFIDDSEPVEEKKDKKMEEKEESPNLDEQENIKSNPYLDKIKEARTNKT